MIAVPKEISRHLEPSAASVHLKIVCERKSPCLDGRYSRRYREDYEHNPGTSEAMIRISMISLMSRRIANDSRV